MAYIGTRPTIGNFVKLDTITTSATATYNLLSGGVAYSPQSANHCIVSLNGVIQSPNTSFTISGSTIVFASALTATDVIDFILILGDTLNVGVPSDATVGFSKITSNLITGATAETSIADGDSLLIYDDSATALRKMTKSNLFSGVAVNAPAFHAWKSTNQSPITSQTFTKITFGSEVYDTNNNFASSTFTPTVAGYYQVTGSYSTEGLQGTGVTRQIISIYKNGGEAIRNDENHNGFQSYISGLVYCNGTTDYLDLYCFIVGSGTLGILGADSGRTFFQGALVRTG